MTQELTLIIEKMELAPEQSKTLLDGFGDLFVQAHKLTAQSKAIKVTREDQVEEMAKAKEFRVKLMRVRKSAEEAKRTIKEPYLRGAQASQDIYNDIKKITEPEEARLKEQEKFAEIAEAKRVETRHTERVEKLSLYVADVSVYSLKDMSDEVFETLVADNKRVYDAKVKAEENAEKDRLAEIEAEKKRQVDIEIENVRLKEEARIKAEAEIERLEIEKAAKKAQKENDEKEEKIRLEKEAKIKTENDEIIRLAKKAREEAEKKLREAKELAEKKLNDERLTREAKEEEAEKIAKEKLLAPDKEKIMNLHSDLLNIEMPKVKSKQAGDVIDEAEKKIAVITNWLYEEYKKL